MIGSYKNGRNSFVVDTASCEICGGMYYPPETCRLGYGRGLALPLCGDCKYKRKKQKINEGRKRRRGEPKLKKWELILKALQQSPKTREELQAHAGSPKPHITYLRSLGYDIRCVGAYELVKEPKDRLVEVYTCH